MRARESIKALRGIEWVELAFPDVNMHVHAHEQVHVRTSFLALNSAGYAVALPATTHSIPR
jgi:hypothetical protein